MNLRKLFLVPAFLSVSFFMASCTTEPSDELVEQDALKMVNWAMNDSVDSLFRFLETSGIDYPDECVPLEVLEVIDVYVEGKSVSGTEAHVKWSARYECDPPDAGTVYHEFFYRKYDKEGWRLEDWPTFSGGD